MRELVPIPSPGVPVFYGEAGLPLIVVVHDWYGRTPGLDPLAAALAHRGFRVAVVDLYDGVCTVDSTSAQSLLQALDVGVALGLIDDTISDARLEGSRRVGVLGFSMGGWLTLLHAQGGSADAVVAYYATLETAEHGVIPNPVLLHLAEYDEWGAGAEPEAFIARLKDHGTPIASHSYIGTQHSFANASIPRLFDANAAALAFARSASYFETHLLGP
jgi:carboxymethylenebutenolidase